MYNFIAYFWKGGDFLKSYWAKWPRKQAAFFHGRTIKGAESNIFTCKLGSIFKSLWLIKLSRILSSLRSRRLQVVGARQNEHARGRHARSERAPSPLACLLFTHPFFLAPITSKRLLRRLYSLIHEPRTRQIPKLSRANCVTIQLTARVLDWTSVLIVGCLGVFLAALNKVFRKASLSLMKEQFSRLSKSAASNIISYFVSFRATMVKDWSRAWDEKIGYYELCCWQ